MLTAYQRYPLARYLANAASSLRRCAMTGLDLQRGAGNAGRDCGLRDRRPRS